MLASRVHPQHAGYLTVHSSAWNRVQAVPEIVTDILCHLERHERVPVARVCKGVNSTATKLIWHCVDSRALMFLTKGVEWRTVGYEQGMVHLIQAPTQADWLRWEPLAAHTQVYCDQSYEDAFGIEVDDIVRLLSTRPTSHLFPNLRKAFILETHISPLFLSPSLSELHLTIGCDKDKNGHFSFMEDAALWISDYIPNLEHLHVYPDRSSSTAYSSLPAVNCIQAIINVVKSTLIETSFPPYYVNWSLLQSLLRCSNLHSIYGAQYPLANPTRSVVWKGLRDDILVSYESVQFPMNLACPFKHINVINLSFPYPDIATQLFAETVLSQLDTLALHFTVLQPNNVGQPALSKLSLTPLFYQLYRCAPNLRRLKIFMVPLQGECTPKLKDVPIVNWIDLSPITLFHALVSFEIAHVWPIDVSSLNIAYLIRHLPYLESLILNPRPIIMHATQYGIDVLFTIAAWGRNLTHVGIFMNKPTLMPVIEEGTFFSKLQTLYVGTSFTPEDDDIYNTTCHALYYLLPPGAKIETCPLDSAAFFPLSAFIEEADGELSYFSTGYVRTAEESWASVKTSIDLVRDTVHRVGGTCLVRREDIV